MIFKSCVGIMLFLPFSILLVSPEYSVINIPRIFIKSSWNTFLEFIIDWFCTLNCFLVSKQPLHSDPAWGRDHCLRCLWRGQKVLMSIKRPEQTSKKCLMCLPGQHSPLNLGGLFKPPNSEVWFSPWESDIPNQWFPLNRRTGGCWGPRRKGGREGGRQGFVSEEGSGKWDLLFSAHCLPWASCCKSVGLSKELPRVTFLHTSSAP